MTSDLVYNLLTIGQLTDESLDDPEVAFHLSSRFALITVTIIIINYMNE